MAIYNQAKIKPSKPVIVSEDLNQLEPEKTHVFYKNSAETGLVINSMDTENYQSLESTLKSNENNLQFSKGIRINPNCQTYCPSHHKKKVFYLFLL